MNLKYIVYLMKKEFMSIFRDKRSLITLIVFPLLFYPSIIIGLNYFQQNANKDLNKFVPTIIIKDSDGVVRGLIEESGSFKILDSIKDTRGTENNKIQGTLEVQGIPLSTGDKNYELIYKFDSTNAKARKSYEMIGNIVEEYNKNTISNRLRAFGINQRELQGINISSMDTASKKKQMGMAFVMIPFFMLISVVAGAASAGIDLTAGEKERGTIATLLSSQLDNREIVVGKVIVVSLLGIFSSVLSVIGLLIATKVNDGQAISISMLPLKSILLILAVLLPVSILIGSIIVNIGLYSRTVKEGNSYVIPLHTIIIFCGILTTIDGFNLSSKLFMVPILNAVFTLRSILLFDFNQQLFYFTIISTIIFSIISMCFSMKMCESETVLFRT